MLDEQGGTLIVRIENVGDADAGEFTLTVTTPSGLRVQKATGGCTADGAPNPFRCRLDGLAKGDVAWVNIRVARVPGTTIGNAPDSRRRVTVGDSSATYLIR